MTPLAQIIKVILVPSLIFFLLSSSFHLSSLASFIALHHQIMNSATTSSNDFQHGVEYHHSTLKTNTLSVDKLDELGISQSTFFSLTKNLFDNFCDFEKHQFRIHSFPMARLHKHRQNPIHAHILFQKTLTRKKTRCGSS